MKKAIVAASTATALVLASLTPTFAAPADRGGRPAAEKSERGRHVGPRFTSEDYAAFAAARLAALKVGLQLTSEQEAHWGTLETALHTIADERAKRFTERRSGRDEDSDDKDNEARDERGRPDGLQRLSHQAEVLRIRAENLTKIAAAAKPLYDSLNDTQKRRFSLLLRETLDGNFGAHHGPDRNRLR